jgi:hypothetical protein
MDHPCFACPVSTVLREMAGMAFREVLVTQVREVLRAWLAGLGKRPAAARGRVNVKTAQRYIAAAREAGLSRDGGEEQLADELLGMVVAAVRPARPAGHGESWQLLEGRKEDIREWVKDDLTLVKIGEKLERPGTAVPYRTLARFAAEECGWSSGGRKATVPVDDGEPGQELQVDFGYLGMIPDGDRRRKLHALVFTAVFSRYCYVCLTFRQTTEAVIAGCGAAWAFFGGVFPVLVTGQPEAGGAGGGPGRAAVEPGVAGVRAGPRDRRGPGEGPVPAGQGQGRVRGEVRPAELLRRGGVPGHRGRAAAGR